MEIDTRGRVAAGERTRRNGPVGPLPVSWRVVFISVSVFFHFVFLRSRLISFPLRVGG